jgi:hypothetical protein
MLGAFKSLFHSEKAVAVGLLVVGATVMVFTGEITASEWMDYTKFLAVTYVGGKTVQGVATVLKKKD